MLCARLSSCEALYSWSLTKARETSRGDKSLERMWWNRKCELKVKGDEEIDESFVQKGLLVLLLTPCLYGLVDIKGKMNKSEWLGLIRLKRLGFGVTRVIWETKGTTEPDIINLGINRTKIKRLEWMVKVVFFGRKIVCFTGKSLDKLSRGFN